jgi:hypothetical protein
MGSGKLRGYIRLFYDSDAIRQDAVRCDLKVMYRKKERSLKYEWHKHTVNCIKVGEKSARMKDL